MSYHTMDALPSHPSSQHALANNTQPVAVPSHPLCEHVGVDRTDFRPSFRPPATEVPLRPLGQHTKCGPQSAAVPSHPLGVNRPLATSVPLRPMGQHAVADYATLVCRPQPPAVPLRHPCSHAIDPDYAAAVTDPKTAQKGMSVLKRAIDTQLLY